MVEVVGNQPRSMSQPFPIPEKELGNLLAAIGNNEAKSNLFIQLRSEQLRTSGDLYTLFVDSQGSRPAWKMDRKGLFAYCWQTFEPIGLVAKEAIDATGTTFGYMKTYYGERIGTPLAGLLMDFSLRHPDISLEDIFGSTSANSPAELIEVDGQNVEYKKRSPLLRFKIMWELATAQLPGRIADLTHGLGENPAKLNQALEQLSDRDIVDYNPAAPTHERTIYYKLSPDHPREHPGKVRTQRALTSDVYDLIIENPNVWWSVNKMAGEIGVKKTVYQTISFIMSQLAMRKYLLRDGYTSINLTEDQRSLIWDLLSVLDNFQKGDRATLERGRLLAHSFSPEDIASLMGKAKEHSSSAKRLSIESAKEYTESVIAENPGITNNQLRIMLMDKLGKIVTTRSVWTYVNVLREERRISENKRDNISHWNIVKH